MKPEIIDRITQLGGTVDRVKGQSLADDLTSITFDLVLYAKPEETPWDPEAQEEPIPGIEEFLDEHVELYRSDQQALRDLIIDQFFDLTFEANGQLVWQPGRFTPFTPGTPDYDEWHDVLADDVAQGSLSEIITLTGDPAPEFVGIFYNFGYPDLYFVCQSDPDQDDPTVFGTDQTAYFQEISNEGGLEEFLNNLMTLDDVWDFVAKYLGSDEAAK